MKTEKTVFTLHDRVTDEQQVSYSRACHNEEEWSSADNARHSNVHGEYCDTEKYRVRKWKVTYTLLEDDA